MVDKASSDEMKRPKMVGRIILIILFFVAGISLFIISFSSYRIEKIDYFEKNNIDYRVYLKPNKFFEEPYLGKNKTYVTSLIDYIDVDYKYNSSFSEAMDTTLNYQIIATVLADKADVETGNYWSKVYALTDKTPFSVENNKTISIGENVKINYDEYNSVLNEFKNTYGVAVDGKLKIEMIITGEATNEKMDSPIIIDSRITMQVPLSALAIEASIDSNTTDRSQQATYRVEVGGSLLIIMRCFGISLAVISIILIILTIKKHLKDKNDHLYIDHIKKILDNYDSVIVNVSASPLSKNQKCTKVENFTELVDMYNSTHEPIYYFRTKSISNFVIIKDQHAYMFSLSKSDFKDKRTKREKKQED